MQDHVLVDTAAGQALIGKIDRDNFQNAFRHRVDHVHEDQSPIAGTAASGIGGEALPMGKAWVPCALA
eukprot:5493354-Pyramimonas_sp.AAC.1